MAFENLKGWNHYSRMGTLEAGFKGRLEASANRDAHLEAKNNWSCALKGFKSWIWWQDRENKGKYVTNRGLQKGI